MTLRSRLPGIPLAGRAAVVACLLLALLAPALPLSRAPVDVVVLVDDSLSMPRGFAGEAWRQLSGWLSDAPAHSRVQLFRFGTGPVREFAARPAAAIAGAALPRNGLLDSAGTDVAAALQEGLRAAADRYTLIVLISDLAATTGDTAAALESAHRSGIPVYLVAPSAGRPADALALDAVQVPSSARTRERIPVTALVESGSAGSLDISLEVNGRVTARRTLATLPQENALIAFDFVPTEPGVVLVTVRVERSASDSRGVLNVSATRAVNVLGESPVLVLSRRSQDNPIAASLQRSGWDVQVLSPAAFTAPESILRDTGVVILDDVAISDLPGSAWDQLVHAVRFEGRGLAVLGGRHSFGAGAYRHSTLEGILPVTAESQDPQEPAAVAFVLDRSGSMGATQRGPDRLSLARRAIANSMEMLQSTDYVSIVGFAADAELLLPPGEYAARRTRVADALAVPAAGGTRVGPALELAAEQLRRVDARQRLIVLVTDGFTGDQNLQDIADRLKAGKISVIALAIGESPGEDALRLLTGFNAGRLLKVADTATLPRLMSREVGTHLAPLVAEPTLPLTVQPLPFELEGAGELPQLSGYMRARARPAAQVYLRSGGGDPLFVTGIAGSGRVAVLPAGLGSWASDWWAWSGFGRFLGGIINWLDPGPGSANLSIAAGEQPGGIALDIESRSEGGAIPQEPAQLLVDDPLGNRTTRALQPVAPDRYRALVPATVTGLYRLTARVDGETLSHAVFRDADQEHRALAADPARIDRWLEQGLVQPWPGAGEALNRGPRDSSSLREVLLVLSLVLYLLVLSAERGLFSQLTHRLRGWFSIRRD